MRRDLELALSLADRTGSGGRHIGRKTTGARALPPTVGEHTLAPAGKDPGAVELLEELVLDSDDVAELEDDGVSEDVELLVEGSEELVELSVEVGDGSVEVWVGDGVVAVAVGSPELVTAGVLALSRLAHR